MLNKHTREVIKRRKRRQFLNTTKRSCLIVIICLALFLAYLYIINEGLKRSEAIRANTYEQYK